MIWNYWRITHSIVSSSNHQHWQMDCISKLSLLSKDGCWHPSRLTLLLRVLPIQLWSPAWELSFLHTRPADVGQKTRTLHFRYGGTSERKNWARQPSERPASWSGDSSEEDSAHRFHLNPTSLLYYLFGSTLLICKYMPSALVGCLNEVPKNIWFLVQDLAIVAGGFAGAGFQCLLCRFDKHAIGFQQLLFFLLEDSPSFSDIRDDSGLSNFPYLGTKLIFLLVGHMNRAVPTNFIWFPLLPGGPCPRLGRTSTS